jgi:hypothetical protein
MFNKKSLELEITESMQNSLLSNAVDKKVAIIQKLASALEHLNAAADIFDDVGLEKEAEYTTALLEIAAQAQGNNIQQKLMQALQPELAAQVKWNSFNINQVDNGIELSGEFQLSPQAEQIINKIMPIVNGQPMLFANYLSSLAKKVDPRVQRSQFIRYTPSVKKAQSFDPAESFQRGWNTVPSSQPGNKSTQFDPGGGNGVGTREQIQQQRVWPMIPIEVQRLLNAKGWKPALVLDGKLGPATARALEWWKNNNDYPPGTPNDKAIFDRIMADAVATRAENPF